MKISRYYFLVLLIVIIGAFLRFFMLADKSLWSDEGLSLFFSDGSSIQEFIKRMFRAETSEKFQPLYFLLLFYWRQLLGNSEFVLRALSAFFGAGAIIIMFYTTLQLYGKRHALWSVILMSVSSYCIYYSQQMRPYGLLLFLAALQLYFFSKALNEAETEDKVIWRVLFGIVTGIGLFGSIFIGIFALALCLAYILVYRNPKRWLQWWIPTALFCLPAASYIIFSSSVATDPSKGIFSPLRQPIIANAAFVIYGLLVGETYGPPIEGLRGDNKMQILLGYWPQLAVLLLVVIPIFVALVMRLRQQLESKKSQKTDYFFAALFVISFFLAFLFTVAAKKTNWLPRHSFYIYIPLVVLIPLVIKNKYRDRKPLQEIVFQIARPAIIALVILNIYSNYNYYFVENYQRDDYRSAAKYLLANQKPSVKSIMLFGTSNLLSYYGYGNSIDLPDANSADWKKESLAEKVMSLTNDAETVFITLNFESYWEWKNQISVEKAMSDLYTKQSKVSYTNFSIYRFLRKQKVTIAPSFNCVPQISKGIGHIDILASESRSQEHI
jgi:4-amino-4-deoxy-L-arabinose transferase-like glycosyltransferase